MTIFIGSERNRWKVIAFSKIRDIRKQKGLTQRRLADLTGIPRSSMSEIESGIMIPKPNQLIRIAKILGVDVDELL